MTSTRSEFDEEFESGTNVTTSDLHSDPLASLGHSVNGHGLKRRKTENSENSDQEDRRIFHEQFHDAKDSTSKLSAHKTQPSELELLSGTSAAGFVLSIPKIEVGAADVDLMRQKIMAQLTNRSFPFLELSVLHAPYKEVLGLLKHTIDDGESHSALLVGHRGSGKTLIVDRALDTLRRSHGSDAFIAIKLNALLHTDDKLAIREIARQLDSRLTTKSKVTFEQRAINETFSNILLGLGGNSDTGKAIPIIFVVEEVEKFADRSKQTLLYNLFELSNSLAAPICVMGVTTKVTTRELLEKRVRSRFSQRIITIRRPAEISDFWDSAKLLLMVDPTSGAEFSSNSYPKQWNAYIEELFKVPSSLKKLVYRIFFTTKNYRDFNNSCMVPVAEISTADPFPQSTRFEKYLDLISQNYILSALQLTSHLETLLIVAATRWVEKSSPPHVNFNLAYQEYQDMMKQHNLESTALTSNTSYIDSSVLANFKVSQKIWLPQVMRDCWANLYSMGLTFDLVTSNTEVNVSNNSNHYKLLVLEDLKMLQVDTTLEEISSAANNPLFKKLARL